VGSSIGRRDGDTLIIETVSGCVERIRQTAPDRLESQMTIEDPETRRIDTRRILNAIWAASERWWTRVRRQGRYRSKKGPARHGGSRTPRSSTVPSTCRSDSCRRLDVVNGSIVDRRHLVNVMRPNDSNDHYSSRSAANYPNVAGLRQFFPETSAASTGSVLSPDFELSLELD
jgi:hypothetical protein